MGAKIKGNEIIEENVFTPLIEEMVLAEKAMDNLSKSFVKDIKKISTAADSIEFDKDLAQGIENVEEATKKLIRTEIKLAKAEEAKAKLKKQLNGLRGEEIKEKLKIQKANKALKDGLKAEIILEEQYGKQIKNNTDVLKNLDNIQNQRLTNINDSIDRNKALRVIVRGLNEDVKEEADAIIRLNAVIDANTEFQNKNSDERLKAINNTGNYTESINEAIESSGAFSNATNVADEATGGLVTTITTVIVNLKLQAKATEDVEQATSKTRRSIKSLNNVLKASIITVIVVALVSMVKAFTESREGARELSILAAQLSNAVLLLGESLIKVVKGGLRLFLAGQAAGILLLKELKLAMLEVQNLNPFVDKEKEIAKTNEEIEILKKNIDDLATTGFEMITTSFDEFGNVLVETNAGLRTLLELQDRLIDRNAIRELQLAKLIGLEERQSAIADDDARSLIEMEKAQRALIVIQSKRLMLEREIAEDNLRVATMAIRLELERKGLSDQVTTANIRNLSFLEKKQLADAISLTTLEELKAASIALEEVEAQQLTTAIEAGSLLNRIRRDNFEQQLDFAIDVFDREKSILEGRIANTKIEHKERLRLQDQLDGMAEESFKDQIKLTQDFIKGSIDERLKLATSRERLDQEEIDRLIKQRATAEEFDLERIIALGDQKLIRQQLLDLGLADEITTNRIKEIIVERVQAEKDLLDARTALNEEIKQSEEDLLTFRREVVATLAQENTDARIKDFEEAEKFDIAKFESANAAIEKEKEARLSLVELEEDLLLQEASNESERTRIVEEANEKRRLIEKETLEQRVELAEKANEKIGALATDGIELIESIQLKQSQKRLDQLDAELAAIQKQKTQLAKAEEEGIANASKNLAIAEAQEAQVQQRRAKELRRQERLEARLVFLKLLAAKVEAGDPNPFVSASLDFVKTDAFLKSLDSFDKGVDRIGHTDKPVDSKGGMVTINHPGEMIIQKDLVESMGNPKREDVVSAFLSWNKFKNMEVNTAHAGLHAQGSYQSNGEMLKKMNTLIDVTQNQYKNIPSQRFEFKPVEQLLIEKWKKRNKTDIYVHNVGDGGVFGEE